MEQYKYNSYLKGYATALLSLVFPCLLSSCTEDLDIERTTDKITISIDGDDINGRLPVTRGSKVNTIGTFGVCASAYSNASTYTSAGCGSYFFNVSAFPGTPTEYYWPTTDYKLSFFGHYPYGNSSFTIQSNASSIGAPTYAYTVPSAIGSQLDIMTGQNVNVQGGGSSPVVLTMKHRCAAICFSVTNDRSSSITVNSISIEGVKYSGTLNEDTWTLSSSVNSSSSNPFTLSYGSSIAASATVNITGTTNIFLMLPQTIPAGAKVKMVVDSEEMETDITGSWVAGKQYNYSITIADDGIVIDPLTDIADWTEDSKNLSITGVSTDDTWSQPSISGSDGMDAEDWTEEDE